MRAVLLCLVPVLALAAGCAGPREKTVPTPGTYRAVWTVHPAAGNAAALRVTSPPVRVDGKEIRVRTGLERAEVDHPAFPEFLTKLSPTARSGVIELVTRATVLEATRNKKGKLKVHKRFIGGLLPVRPGEKLGVNGPGDPVVVEVELTGGDAGK